MAVPGTMIVNMAVVATGPSGAPRREPAHAGLLAMSFLSMTSEAPVLFLAFSLVSVACTTGVGRRRESRRRRSGTSEYEPLPEGRL